MCVCVCDVVGVTCICTHILYNTCIMCIWSCLLVHNININFINNHNPLFTLLCSQQTSHDLSLLPSHSSSSTPVSPSLSSVLLPRKRRELEQARRAESHLPVAALVSHSLFPCTVNPNLKDTVDKLNQKEMITV